MNRRTFITTTANGLAATALTNLPLTILNPAENKIKAVALDAFTIFDTKKVVSFSENMFPGKGVELNNVWRIKQFDYCWLRTTAGKYKNFWDITSDALVYAANKVNVELSDNNREKLMTQFLSLDISRCYYCT